MTNYIPQTTTISQSELILSLTTALDMTEGQPVEHCMRCCWIGMHIGKALQLNEQQLYDLFFTILLKDTGCSSNAARICQLYGTDERQLKNGFKTMDTSLIGAVRFVMKNAGSNQNWYERLRTTLDILKNGPQYAKEVIYTRCTRGADIARELLFDEEVALSIYNLDEHWDGGGSPHGVAGSAIPLYARIALTSQIIDVFHYSQGMSAAIKELRKRSGTWLDPELVIIAINLLKQEAIVAPLSADTISEQVLAIAPVGAREATTDDYFDRIVRAFGSIIDAKSPFTSGHSERVALFSDMIATELGLPEADRLWIRRGARLHDLGKLGVSNTILDKPGKLDEDEWEAMKQHASYTYDILKLITPLERFAYVAASHHEKLDGTGYPNGLRDEDISLVTRIITTADIFDAITAERPYRKAVPAEKTLDIMQGSVGTAIDSRCFDALKRIIATQPDEIAKLISLNT
ncbi:Cyclic di-GMP phosphodiesterase response regulator RpfG [Marinomonas spartinae]|uniref:Cyclic di-GMP phosphodiesterase response regulator RpfG n=1 Tax=Marinomonas spartinae TaxID=1792290 RepID=A0A1A8TME4_9GAMM|nr:HD-GYP domain-containing protein [Marinomonas spartinae]SBS35174.1 Cyclic di-GMP phosphodiesterase response regulator RpfG [Marinomonas spartinae]SBS39499.1 Cyclic di-GMP phosphodiesterase response regulator RpfG [Marinomonas spartinae]